VDLSPEGVVSVAGGDVTAAGLLLDFDPDGDDPAFKTPAFATREIAGDDVVRASFISFSLYQPEPDPRTIVSFSREPFVAPIPLPAGVPLFPSGLGGLTILGRQRSA
jgi:hypothetical protein